MLALAAAISGNAEVIDIDNQQLTTLMAAGVPLVDVRTTSEWQQTGVIAGSHLLTFFKADGSYDAQAWLAALGAFARPDQPVILICRSGNRSGSISAFLDSQAGFHTVYNVKHGIVHWIRQGNPTTKP